MPAHTGSSERTHQGAERDDGSKRYKGADDADHNDITIAGGEKTNISNKWCWPQSLILAIFDFFVFDMGSHLLTILVNDPDRNSRVSWRIRSSLYGFVGEKNVTASAPAARVRQRNECLHPPFEMALRIVMV
jgi:hypothetical protein